MNSYLTNNDIMLLRQGLEEIISNDYSIEMPFIVGYKIKQNFDYLTKLSSIFQQQQERIFAKFGTEDLDGTYIIAEEHKDEVVRRINELNELPVYVGNLLSIDLVDLHDIKLPLYKINFLSFFVNSPELEVPKEIEEFDPSFVYDAREELDRYEDKEEGLIYIGSDALEKKKEHIINPKGIKYEDEKEDNDGKDD